MNSPAILPPQFDPLHIATLRLQAAALPRPAPDSTPEGFFSRPFSTEEIDAVKAHVRKNCLGSARGLDRLSYDELLTVPSEDLRDLFQLCNYRAIGLESCALKVMTILIDRRLREWAESTGQSPLQQSGFRKAHRIVNNSVILRVCIEKARSMGTKSLYVLLLDIENAFP
ncbi:hypothetical protein C8T65DRAFT_588893 [Cerioporus squamosus]|nr:hypothetical protein C8T65DRAFT_588893 [Cerioporus squamosus]